MRINKFAIAIHHLHCGLADDNKIHDDGLLSALVHKEALLAQAFNEATGISRGLLNMV
jgi:hypothetical protein